MQEQGTCKLLPVEVKSSAASNTMEETHNWIKSIVGISDYERGKKYIFALHADDKKLHNLIQNSLYPKRLSQQLFQLLHHPYVFGSIQVLLIVGTGKQFQFAVYINFPDVLFKVYSWLIGKCYNK